MSKRKAAKASKRARIPKIAVQVQRNENVVKSAKQPLLRSVATGPVESPAELQHEPPQTVIEQKPPVEDRTTAIIQDGISQLMRESALKKQPDYSLAPNMLAYQAKLLEMMHDSLGLAFEFNQRLATIRTPYEVFDLSVEFTKKRIHLITRIL